MRRKSEKKAVQKDVDVLKNQLARALADYDNLTKRVEKERETIEKLASLKIVVKLLGVYDMLIKAQNHLNDSGLAISLGHFEEILKEEGIEKIKIEKGDKFDPNLHEAVEVINSPAAKNKGLVAEVVLDGWKLKDGPVIRHTKVKVYSDKIEEAKKAESELSKGKYM